MFNIVVCGSADEVAAEAFAQIRPIIRKPSFILGLATGSSPLGLYGKMIDDHNLTGTTYRSCITYNLDEYVGISKDHPQSYHTFMQENLFRHIDINPENIHIPEGDTGDLEKACADYETLLAEHIADVQILGIGANGHIGFNEPGTPFDSLTHVVNLTEQTRKDNSRFFDGDISKVPGKAITMGLGSILKARKIVIIAMGKNKAKAVNALIHEKPDAECPASVLQNHHNVTLICDRDAASMLMLQDHF